MQYFTVSCEKIDLLCPHKLIGDVKGLNFLKDQVLLALRYLLAHLMCLTERYRTF